MPDADRDHDHARAAVDFAAVFHALLVPYVVMTPEFVILEANDAYLSATGRARADLVGQQLFEVFPAQPESLDSSGVPRIETSLRHVVSTGRPDTMPLQRYDLTDPVTGTTTERYWVLSAVPVLDADGRTVVVVQRAEDVTGFMLDREEGRRAIEAGGRWRQRVEVVEAQLLTLALDLSAALTARDEAARRVAAMNEVALALTAAATVEDLEQVVVGRGLGALGVDGGAVISREDGGWRITVNASLGEHVQVIYGHLPFDSPLPACWSARTGQRLELPTRASGLAFDDSMERVYVDTRRSGWAFLPLVVAGERLGSLAVSWVDEHTCSREELDVLDGFAAQCAQALERIRGAQAQREAAAVVARMAEGLQRSLLTEPPRLEHLQIAARYVPAAAQAQVGGDWYDAFVVRDGSTCLVIGDVAGHDRDAAVAMAGVRNVLRGVAHALVEPPARVLSALDRAFTDLTVTELATAVLAKIERGPGPPGRGPLTMRWSNAGHPPPLLIHRDGRAELLARPADLLLGAAEDTARHDHTDPLPPGATVVLYTDGLVERRGEDLDVGLERLRLTAQRLAHLGVEDLCDALLGELASGAEDDVALLATRALP